MRQLYLLVLSFLVTVVCFVVMSAACQSQTVCPRCGRVIANYQQQAQAVAEEMANRRMRGHLHRQPAGVFEGTGRARGQRASTCTPHRLGRQLIADATAYRGDEQYRVRWWR